MNTTSVYKRLSQSFLSHINQKSIEIYKHFAKKMKKMGRLGGIEPPSQVPQTRILTIIRQSPILTKNSNCFIKFIPILTN
jgi:hypothetical protein